jgi:hypothetical protein
MVIKDLIHILVVDFNQIKALMAVDLMEEDRDSMVEGKDSMVVAIKVSMLGVTKDLDHDKY